MEGWRLCKREHARSPLDGVGAQRFGGRWNQVGRPVAYLSATLSLAALELLVHLEVEAAPDDLVAVRVDIPDDVTIDRLDAGQLPKGWRSYPAPEELQELGDRWLRSAGSPVLRVPSAVVPEESNYLINPLHPESRRVRVLGTKRFTFDPRLF